MANGAFIGIGSRVRPSTFIQVRAMSADRKPHFENAVFGPHKPHDRTIFKNRPHPKKPHKTARAVKTA